MSRYAYAAQRRAERDARETREARGLPHHPDGTGWATCIACQGSGSHEFNLSPDNDPQCDDFETCATCDGTGYVPDGRGPDLLMQLQARRLSYRWSFLTDFAYRSARRRAMCPVSGLALADMRALATRCVTEVVARVLEMRGAA